MLSGLALPGPGADAAAEAAAAAGLSDLWPHITGSVESGVTAGFQLASAAGPLCDEALWGVVFEVEVRLLLPPPGTDLDLAEGVYGPFSGQVRGRQPGGR
jgi:ribosome assembly protein 1